MAQHERSVSTSRTADFPFGGLGMSLEVCEAYAETLHVQVHTWTVVNYSEDIPLYQSAVSLSGYRLLTVLNREIRGR